MFPFHEHYYRNVDQDGSRIKTDVKCDLVSSSRDVFENVYPLEENVDLDSIDPSLFCPDIILEQSDTPIRINNDEDANSGHKESSEEENEKNATSDLVRKVNEIRRNTFGSDNPVQFTKIHCTACFAHLGSALSERENRYMHPLLKVLICKKCYDFYTSGDFDKDEDGSESFCRWCGQGGKVICCSKCDFVFCLHCIRMNLGRNKLVDIKNDDNWSCFNCDPSQILELRSHCAELMDYVQKQLMRIPKAVNVQSIMETDYSKCCPHAANVVETKKKRNAVPVDPTYNPESSRSRNSSNLRKTTIRKKPEIIVPKITNTIKELKPVNNTAVAGVAQQFIFVPQPVLKPTINPISNSSKLYLAPVNLHHIKVLPDGRKVILANNSNPENKIIPAYYAFQKIPGPSDDRVDFQRRKAFYKDTLESALKAQNCLSSGLMQVTKNKSVSGGLEDMVITHNKLHDVINKSISSLKNLHRQVAGFKLDKPNVSVMEVSKQQIPIYTTDLNKCGSSNKTTFRKNVQNNGAARGNKK